MNIITLVSCVLLIFDLEANCEETKHDSIQNNNDKVKLHHPTDIIYKPNNNVNIIGKSTTNPNRAIKEISMPKGLKVIPVYNVIPRTTLHVLNNAQTPITTVNLSNTTKVPIIVELAENRKDKSLVILSNDTDTPNEIFSPEILIQNITIPSANMFVTSNNEVEITSKIDDITKSINLDEPIEKATENVVLNKNHQHKQNQMNHHKKENESIYKTIEISTDTNQLSKPENVPMDTVFENKLKEERKEKQLESNKLLKVLNHTDAKNERDAKLSNDTIERSEPSTKLEDSKIFKYLSGLKSNDNGSNNQGLSKPPYVFDNQSKNGTLIYSELRPDFNPRNLFNRMSNINENQQAKYYEYQPENKAELIKKKRQQQCRHLKISNNDQHQHYILNITINKTKYIFVPYAYKVLNNKPYYECIIPNYYDDIEIAEYIYPNINKLNNNLKLYYDPINEIIEPGPNRQLQHYITQKMYTDEDKDDLEYLKVTTNWNEAIKDLNRVKNDDYDNWYKYINRRPNYNINLLKEDNSRYIKHDYSWNRKHNANNYFCFDPKFKSDSKRYDEVKYRKLCSCS